MPSRICTGRPGLADLKGSAIVDETKQRVDELEKCIDVIGQLEANQDNINEALLDKICDHREDIDWITDTLVKFVDLYQCKEEIQDNKIKTFKEKCNKYKRNVLLGFIANGVVDIALCVMILIQMYM